MNLETGPPPEFDQETMLALCTPKMVGLFIFFTTLCVEKGYTFGLLNYFSHRGIKNVYSHFNFLLVVTPLGVRTLPPSQLLTSSTSRGVEIVLPCISAFPIFTPPGVKRSQPRFQLFTYSYLGV